MPDDEITQRRSNIAAMELLQRSHQAYNAGDVRQASDLMDQATQEAPATVAALIGAMRIGEVPQPGAAEWDDYLAAQRAALDTLLAEREADQP
ncbi:MAG: hypothetical protein ACJ72N_07025 [Labedaea sp.]